MILQTMRTDFNEKQFQVEFQTNSIRFSSSFVFQDETYVKLSPIQDENSNFSSATSNTPTTPVDHEQLAREDLKYSVKIFLRSLEPEILSHTIDTSSSSNRNKTFQMKFFPFSFDRIERKLFRKFDDFFTKLWCSFNIGRIYALMACC